MTKWEGFYQNGFKRRIASHQIKYAECFRIPENPKIFVSAAIENALFTKRIGKYLIGAFTLRYIADCHRRCFSARMLITLFPIISELSVKIIGFSFISLILGKK